MTKEKSCDGSCECARGISRRDFLKVAAATSLLAGCSPALQSVNPTDEATAAPTSAPTTPPTSAPTAMVIPTAAPDLTGKKVVYILPRFGFAPVCHAASQAVLEEGGASISFASWELDEIPALGGGASPLQPDMLVSDVQAADFDAIIFECGQFIEAGDPEAQRIVREAVEQDKVLAAICMMPALLAVVGVLEGKRAACNSDYADIVEAKGAILTGATVERDGNIITASFEGYETFGWVVAEALAG
jgi:protease I